jgi:hypothetical protein
MGKNSRHLFLFLGLLSPFFLKANDVTLDSTNKRNYTIFGVPTLGSAPETGFYFGLVGLLDFKLSPDSLARHSVVKAELTYTLKKQFIAATEWTISQKEGKWILFGKNSWLRFPELFWGFGGKSIENQRILYDANRLELANSFYVRVSSQSKWYLGVCQQLQSIYHIKYLDEKELHQENPFYSVHEGVSSGLGLGILKDSRSSILNPRVGEVYFSIQALGFYPALGSQFTFASADLDFRHYRKGFGKGIWAFQALSQHRSLGSPYRMQGLLGGPMMLRGYYFGRYRDLNYTALQAEYRWIPGSWFGFTLFGAGGNVYCFESQNQAGDIKFAGGLGLRILVDKKENSYLRMDMALTGESDFGFYFSFGEAF